MAFFFFPLPQLEHFFIRVVFSSQCLFGLIHMLIISLLSISSYIFQTLLGLLYFFSEVQSLRNAFSEHMLVINLVFISLKYFKLYFWVTFNSDALSNLQKNLKEQYKNFCVPLTWLHQNLNFAASALWFCGLFLLPCSSSSYSFPYPHLYNKYIPHTHTFVMKYWQYVGDTVFFYPWIPHCVFPKT